MTVLPDWLHQRAALTPDRLALITSNERWSFRELDERVTHAAHALKEQGIEENDRVALLLKNGAPFVILLHALSRVGAINVPLNTRLTPAEIQWQLTDAHIRLLIHDEAHIPQAALTSGPLKQLATTLITRHSPLVTRHPPLVTHHSLASPHSLLYTSGTTGQPKGAVLTFGNHWWSAVGSALNLGLHENDRWLACLPLFHVGGLAILLRSVIYGITAEVHEAFEPLAVNRAIDDGVTIVSVVSVMLRRMLEARGDVPYPPTLRCVLLGGGPAPRDLLETCAQRGVPVVQTYGLTEAASQVATLAPADALRKLGSAGKPLFPTELRIERDEGEVGEIVIRGPTITPGYADQPEATAQAWREGWFHTSDLGYLDEEGYLYVLDRRADLIISGGENVYPAEVEAALLAHPAVEEAGVVGAPDEHWGQTPIAFVKLRGPISEAELKQFCAERLARYKIPARIEFVENALPRNAAGKLLRRSLLEWMDLRSAS